MLQRGAQGAQLGGVHYTPSSYHFVTFKRMEGHFVRGCVGCADRWNTRHRFLHTEQTSGFSENMNV